MRSSRLAKKPQNLTYTLTLKPNPHPNQWRKGAKRLSDWMVQGGFAPIDEGIWSLKPPTLVAPPPLQSQREARREAMWQRVAGRARVRPLTSVEGDGVDAALTRSVVRSVMEDSRANEPSTEMTDEEAAELESQQQAPDPRLKRQRRHRGLPQMRCQSMSLSDCGTLPATSRCWRDSGLSMELP